MVRHSANSLLGARDLDPALGVFTSPDPVLDIANPDNYSPYGYANADPINGSDPSGLFDSGMGTWVGVSLPAWFGAATALGVGAVVVVVGGLGVLLGIGLPFIGTALSPDASSETKAWWHNYETCGGGGCYGHAIDAGTGSLSFDRPSVGTTAGDDGTFGDAANAPSDYGYAPANYPGGYAPKAPSTGTPPAYNFAAAEAARKASKAATEAIGSENNAQTAAATGGGRGTGGPSTTTGFGDPGDDDFIDQLPTVMHIQNMWKNVGNFRG